MCCFYFQGQVSTVEGLSSLSQHNESTDSVSDTTINSCQLSHLGSLLKQIHDMCAKEAGLKKRVSFYHLLTTILPSASIHISSGVRYSVDFSFFLA